MPLNKETKPNQINMFENYPYSVNDENMNVPLTLLPNLLAWNNLRWVEMPLKSIN